jgi:hypothetical protein
METRKHYYYVISSSGKKLFFTKNDDKRIAKSKIPSHLLSEIRENKKKSSFVEKVRSNEASDYYYEYNFSGSKYYFDAKTDKKVPKKDIDSSVIHKISGKGENGNSVSEFLSDNPGNYFYVEVESVSKKTYKIIYQINPRIRIAKNKLPTGVFEKIRSGEEALPKFGSHDELLTDYMEDLLKENNITSKKDLKLWLLKNHPDKGGDDELCAIVLSAAKIKGFMD